MTFFLAVKDSDVAEIKRLIMGEQNEGNHVFKIDIITFVPGR